MLQKSLESEHRCTLNDIDCSCGAKINLKDMEVHMDTAHELTS